MAHENGVNNNNDDGSKGLFAGLNMSSSPSKAAPKAPNDSDSTTAATQTHVEQQPCASSVPMRGAPVTDKLLAILGTPPSSPTPHVNNKSVVVEETTGMNGSHATAAAESNETRPPAGEPNKEAESGEKAPPPPRLDLPVLEKTKEKAPPSVASLPSETQGKDSKPAAVVLETKENEDEPSHNEPRQTPDSMFTLVKPQAGTIHPDTPIPHADDALRLLRKFGNKTRPHIPTACGGTQSRGMLGYLFGKSPANDDLTMEPVCPPDGNFIFGNGAKRGRCGGTHFGTWTG